MRTHKRVIMPGLLISLALVAALSSVCLATNALQNPGFEQPVNSTVNVGTTLNYYGWDYVVECDGGVAIYALDGWFQAGAIHGGLQSATCVQVGSLAHAKIYQNTTAQASSQYTASVYVNLFNGGSASPIFGATPTDSASLQIIEYRADGSIAKEHTKILANKATLNVWQQLTDDFTSTENTASIRFLLETTWSSQYGGGTGSFPIFDDCILVPVPESSCLLALLSGLGTLGGIVIRRRK